MKDRSRDDNNIPNAWLHAWYLKPLHWIFFACWAPVLSLIRFISDRKEKCIDQKQGRDRLK